MKLTAILKYILLLILLFVLEGCNQAQDGGVTAVIIAPETIEAGHVFAVELENGNIYVPH